MNPIKKVLGDKFLYQYINNFIPVSKKTIILRRKVISELKHFHCEWSYHITRCCICYFFHPCIINRSGRPRHICNKCNNNLRARLYYFYNY